MKKIMYEIYTNDNYNSELFEKIDEAKELFYGYKQFEPKRNKKTTYELNEVEITYDEDDEIINQEHIKVIDIFEK